MSEDPVEPLTEKELAVARAVAEIPVSPGTYTDKQIKMTAFIRRLLATIERLEQKIAGLNNCAAYLLPDGCDAQCLSCLREAYAEQQEQQAKLQAKLTTEQEAHQKSIDDAQAVAEATDRLRSDLAMRDAEIAEPRVGADMRRNNRLLRSCTGCGVEVMAGPSTGFMCEQCWRDFVSAIASEMRTGFLDVRRMEDHT